MMFVMRIRGAGVKPHFARLVLFYENEDSRAFVDIDDYNDSIPSVTMDISQANAFAIELGYNKNYFGEFVEKGEE